MKESPADHTRRDECEKARKLKRQGAVCPGVCRRASCRTVRLEMRIVSDRHRFPGSREWSGMTCIRASATLLRSCE